MFHPVNLDGLERVALYELGRALPATRQDAERLLKARIGAYNGSQDAIARGVKAYFLTR